MKFQIDIIFQISTVIIFYIYAIFLLTYFIFRFLVWDNLAIIGLISNFIPWIFFPIFIFPIASFFAKEKMICIISVCATLIFLGWIHTKYYSAKALNIDYDNSSINILSMNVGQHLVQSKFLSNFILEQKPDIVFLQEVTDRHIKNSWTNLIKMYPYQVSGPLVSEKMVGMGILSKYPILSSKNFKLAKNGLVFQQKAIIKVGEQKIAIYNIHTTYPWFRFQKVFLALTLPVYDYSIRSKEIENLVKLIQEETLPTIAAGDFNMTDQAQDYNYITKFLIDSFQESGWGFGFTWPAHQNPSGEINLTHPIVRIDYIMHSSDFISKSTQVLSKTGSDHLPIETKLFWFKPTDTL